LRARSAADAVVDMNAKASLATHRVVRWSSLKSRATPPSLGPSMIRSAGRALWDRIPWWRPPMPAQVRTSRPFRQTAPCGNGVLTRWRRCGGSRFPPWWPWWRMRGGSRRRPRSSWGMELGW